MTGDDTRAVSAPRERSWTDAGPGRWNRTMTDEPMPDPTVRPSDAREIAPDVLVIPNQRVGLVPNIGVIAGTGAVLVVETGLGTVNAERLLAFADEVAKGRRLYLTTTHFHPEH